MLIEVNPAAEGLRFPTRVQIEKIIQDIDNDKEIRSKESEYSLVDNYFNRESLRVTELELYALENPYDTGMTYFHTLGTEPRNISMLEDASVQRTRWRGAHFKESAHWGEPEILELAAMNAQFKKIRIQDDVAKAVAGMRLRRKRREEWLAAQVMTTGGIEVSKNLADNPEGVSYKVDYLLHNPTITLTNPFDAKNAEGESVTDIIKFFRDLMEADRKGDYPQYKLREILVTSNFVTVLRENTLFWDTWGAYNSMWTEAVRERRPSYFFDDEYVLNAFRAMVPNVKVTVNDTGYRTDDGGFKQFIPDNHMTLIYGEGKVGNFTYTAHAHSEGGNIRIGTGPYAFVEDGLKKPNPYYSIFSGFHGLPRLTDYDPRSLQNHRLRFLTYAS